MSVATSRPKVPTADLHELAHVERLLRADGRADDPAVTVGSSGAKIRWDTWEPNEHARGSLTAAVATEVAGLATWGLATVHDPLVEDDVATSLLTVVHDSGGDSR